MIESLSEEAGQEARGPAAWVSRLARGERPVAGIAFLLLVVFYLATAAGNLSETDDVYAFAYRAEHFSVDYLSDPRLMLYHIFMRLLFLGSSALGLNVSALTLMRCVSAFCAAASLILLLRVVVADLKLSATTGVLSAVILGSCYGFWRYAAEAEVYIPAILLILLVFHGLSRGFETLGEAGRAARLPVFAGWGVLSGLTVLFYQPGVIPLFFAFPLLLLYRNRILHLGFYLTAGGAVVIAGYLLGFLAFWPEPLSLSAFSGFLSQRAEEFIVPPFTLKTVIVSMIRSAFALGHDFVSVNWVFAFDPLVELIRKSFSSNVITEEVFLARRAGVLVYLPILTLALLLAASLRILQTLRFPPLSLLRERRFLVILVWTAINGAIIGRLNPAGLEAWIMVFPPLVMIFAVCVVEPCFKKGHGRLLAAFAGVLFLHNAIGGMALVFDPANEYDRVKGSWVIANATPEDLVIVNGNAGLVETLRYLSAARVVMIGSFQGGRVAESLLNGDPGELLIRTSGRDFKGYMLRDLIARTWRMGGRLIFFERFFAPPGRISPEVWPASGAVSELQKKLVRVYDAPEVGATYVLAGPVLEGPLPEKPVE